MQKFFFIWQSKKLKSQTTTSFCKTARRAKARRAKLIPLSKRNGRRFAPPANSSGKKKKVLLWSIFTTTLELILSKIRDKNNRPPRLAGRGRNETKKSARGQKISSPKTPPFFAHSPKIFELREM